MATEAARAYPSLFFSVEIDGITLGVFLSCSGLKSETEVVEVYEGGDNVSPRKLPGTTRYGNVVLKQCVTSDPALWQWRQQVIDGKIGDARKNGSVVLLDHSKAEQRRWNFTKGWPCRWEGPDFDSGQSALAVEMIEIAHEGLEDANAGGGGGGGGGGAGAAGGGGGPGAAPGAGGGGGAGGAGGGGEGGGETGGAQAAETDEAGG